MNKYLSPRVIINEIDNSILINSFEGGPILVLGETPQGPDDNIYTIINPIHFINYYGDIKGDYPSMYCAKEYLTYANNLKFKRVTSVKSVKIASNVNITLVESATISGVTSSFIKIPSGISTTPYLDESSLDTVIYLKNESLFTKCYIKNYVGNDGTNKIYDIVWDSYGYTYNVTTIKADIYIGHAEPAYCTDVKFVNPDSTAATGVLTFTNSGETFDQVSYYVTNYVNNSNKFGSNIAPLLTTVSGSNELGTHTFKYRYSYKSATGIETPVSREKSITLSSSGYNVQITMPELPEGFVSYVIYCKKDSGSFYKLVETTSRVYVHTSLDTYGAELAQCPITLFLNGLDIFTNYLSGITHDVYFNSYDNKIITGEYLFDYVYSTSGTSTPIYTIIGGNSPQIEVGTVLYKMEPISLSGEKPNNGAYIEGVTETSIKGNFLLSTYLDTNDYFFFFNSNGIVTIPSTATIKAYYMLGNEKIYYNSYEDGFYYYKAVAKGRGKYGNDMFILTNYNQSNSEWNLSIYSSTGEALEFYNSSSIDDLVNLINESSIRIKLFPQMTPPNLNGFVAYDELYSSDYIKYFYSDLKYGYDGYFKVNVNDFISNIDPFVATSLKNFDPDLADLVTTSDLIYNSESTLDYELLVIPGWSSHLTLANVMYEVCKNRNFISCIIDLPSGLNAAQAVNYRNGTFGHFDSSKIALFWNYAKIYDSINKQYIWLPPSVFAVRAIVYTEQTNTPFAASAGLKRGVLPNVIALEFNPSLVERDLLASAQINPIASISSIITVWGNKTSQKVDSMLSNFNVRRLLNKAEKIIYITSQSVLFNPNDAAERTSIILTLQPIFDIIAQKRGISEFSIIDSTTEDDVAEGIAKFTIRLRPIATIEVIEYDVIINKAKL